MTLRIIGGTFKGRLIKTPKGQHTRPTSSILRKAVFDICQRQISDAKFLDLFAGSGAMGIEAISRGASHATFIDEDKNAHLCIQENIRLLNISGLCEVIKGDAISILKKLEKRDSFDIIYIDPPYGKTLKEGILLIDHVLEILSNSPLVAKDGLIFIEEEVIKIPREIPSFEGLAFIDSRKFGKSLLHQYQKSSG